MEHAPGASAVLLLEEGELGAEATVKKFSTVLGKETGKFAENWLFFISR